MFENLRDFKIIANGHKNKIDLLSLLISSKDCPSFVKHNMKMEIKAEQSDGKYSWIWDEYKDIISTHITNYFNFDLLTETQWRKGNKIKSDVLTIEPIRNTWKCPICYFGHSKPSPPASCIMCGYSLEKTTADHPQKLKVYQQAWFVRLTLKLGCG